MELYHVGIVETPHLEPKMQIICRFVVAEISVLKLTTK